MNAMNKNPSAALLTRAARLYEQAKAADEAATTAREAMYAAIAEAIDGGWSQREICERLGLSKQRMSQLATKGRHSRLDSKER